MEEVLDLIAGPYSNNLLQTEDVILLSLGGVAKLYSLGEKSLPVNGEEKLWTCPQGKVYGFRRNARPADFRRAGLKPNM